MGYELVAVNGEELKGLTDTVFRRVAEMHCVYEALLQILSISLLVVI